MARPKVVAAYRGDVESEIDARILLEACKAGLTSLATQAPLLGEIDVRSGDVYVLRDLAPTGDSILRVWEDGVGWQYTHADDVDFQHFKNIDCETLRRKTWTINDRNHRFSLIIYYTLGKTYGKRPSQDADFLASIYEPQSFWFEAFSCRLQIQTRIEATHNSLRMHHQGPAIGESNPNYSQVARELCYSFECMSIEVSEQVRSVWRDSDSDQDDLDEMDRIRSAMWQDYGLAREIMVLAEKDFDFHDFSQLVETILSKNTSHIGKMMERLEKSDRVKLMALKTESENVRLRFPNPACVDVSNESFEALLNHTMDLARGIQGLQSQLQRLDQTPVLLISEVRSGLDTVSDLLVANGSLVGSAMQQGSSNDQRKGLLDDLLRNFKSCFEELEIVEDFVSSRIQMLSGPHQGGYLNFGPGLFT